MFSRRCNSIGRIIDFKTTKERTKKGVLNLQTKVKGDISEAKALLEFQKRGIPVLIPWGDKERYDMVIELNHTFYRVQVKTAGVESNGSLCCYARSSHNHTTNKRYYKYIDQVDYFVFYNIARDIIAIVPAQDIGDKSAISLRIAPPRNNQEKDIKYFSDYSFDKVLNIKVLYGESATEEKKD